MDVWDPGQCEGVGRFCSWESPRRYSSKFAITDLSRFPSPRVASRRSTVAYEEKPADLGQVSRDLGVKYVLDPTIL